MIMWNLIIKDEKDEVLVDILLNPKCFPGEELGHEDWETNVLSQVYSVKDLWDVCDRITYSVDEVYGCNWEWQEEN